MSFFKTASVQVLGSWSGNRTALKSSETRTASYFLQQPGSIDVEAVLADVSEPYHISANPKDYIFVPVRANSVGVPNENADAFSKQESLRFDHKIGRRVYQTYLAKPHHVNHRTDNPKMARGVIVDVHYNDHNAMPKDWRDRYEAAVGTSLPNDEFVETLLAVDASKDSHLAEGIRSGIINAFSMGCECDRTACSICNHIASNRSQFCDHLKYGNKNKWFDVDGKKRQAFEWCMGVIYAELSAVDTPADPRAVSNGDVFSLQANMNREEYLQVLAFAKINAETLPAPVAEMVADYLENQNV